jgi:uncharacterized peroxidase-related enzyme
MPACTHINTKSKLSVLVTKEVFQHGAVTKAPFFHLMFFWVLAVIAGCSSSPPLSAKHEPGSHQADALGTNPLEKLAPLPRLQPLTPEDWTPEAREALQPVMRNGQVFNVFATLAHHPKLLNAWNPLGLHLLWESTLPARDREMIILKTAVLAGSEYEFAQHAFIGRKVGLVDAEINAILTGQEDKILTDFEQLLIQVCVELSTENTITSATWAALKQQYNDQQILDLIATVGQYRMLAMMLNSIGVPMDPELPNLDWPTHPADAAR